MSWMPDKQPKRPRIAGAGKKRRGSPARGRKLYRDINGDSGISHFAYGTNWIELWWRDTVYRYESSRIGSPHIEEMKRLADAGDKLNTYINTHPEVQSGYSSKRKDS